MRQRSTRLDAVVLATALAWQGLVPTGVEGQELPQFTSVPAAGAQPLLGLRLSADTSAAPAYWLTGGLAGALVGAFVATSIAESMDAPDMSWVPAVMIGESIGLPLGVYFSTTPRGRMLTWALLASSAIGGVAFVLMAETSQPALLVAAVPLQFIASLRLLRADDEKE